MVFRLFNETDFDDILVHIYRFDHEKNKFSLAKSLKFIQSIYGDDKNDSTYAKTIKKNQNFSP